MTECEQIKQECIKRGITRLCHFTPSRKLAHILSGQKGILATSKLERQERDIFNPTDIDRYDGRKDYICCSIEYPNGWYFDKKRSSEVLFKDWVVLFISPGYLWQTGTLFCYRNASASFGRFIQGGIKGFAAMYAAEIDGTYRIQRSRNHLQSCPTDNQAEVLIPDTIGIADIIGVAVENEDQVVRELKRFDLMNLETDISFFICPDLYNKHRLSQLISTGIKPSETRYVGV
ncbi:MAG TPA: DarT ssDNA thymidine ADP-ribosyltransferase family protein [Acetomicrobium sp.]|nr:DarT ssDNA thymidine ADP-ribosyltransferase family protein [Acetomicrobium sp.]